MRASLDTLLRSLGLRVVTFASTAELRAARWENATSCLLLDVRLRGESGLVFQQASDRPSIPIVVISGFADVEVCRKALKGGAVDFLVKPFTDHELIDAVNLALSLDAARRVRNDTHDELRQSFELLTRREREVLAYVVSGALNKQIASHLGLSLITIKQHRASVMRKMNASSLADLVQVRGDRRATGDMTRHAAIVMRPGRSCADGPAGRTRSSSRRPVRRVPRCAVVGVDDRACDREAHSHAVGFARENGSKS